ncbi:lytic murein transglycosylase [Aestuariivirga litoralis]|uniref:lytic murein transglycosylase n=1 Tax=Aestuariivirga litoralis TaxID=2650924 RepID=UPI0018C5D799|nr:lytic murein transglycosylase [Aestuariivirga litoralis]MBG1233127.1 lytic murein transglycosylase [Aestuariivirga litoralis]
MRKLILALLMGVALAAPAKADPKFEAFIQTLWPRVQKAGFSRELFDAAFKGITDPDPVVIKLAKNQPEFKSTTSEYLDKAVTDIRINTGKQMLADNAKLLSAIQAKYGVDKDVLLGIWGVESNFGKDMGSMSVMRCLATLIYTGNKKNYAQDQLIPAFKILKSGIRPPDNFTGSWAGAMGHTQFIPATYISSAADWTGDGKKDIWNSKEDALASTANYLKLSGWKGDRPWGWEVKLPDKFDRSLIGRGHWKPVSEWVKLGITPAIGATFSAPAAPAFVMIPQGMDGPVFLVTQNFKALLAYNFSHAYALAVGHLGDRIGGGPKIQAVWPPQTTDLTFPERVELQNRLTRAGFDTGGADGRFGAQTYEAVLGYQKKLGLALDGFPARKVLEHLRKGG